MVEIKIAKPNALTRYCVVAFLMRILWYVDLVQWIWMTVNVSLRYKFRFVSELASSVMQGFGLLVYASITDIIRFVCRFLLYKNNKFWLLQRGLFFSAHDFKEIAFSLVLNVHLRLRKGLTNSFRLCCFCLLGCIYLPYPAHRDMRLCVCT